jgi:hypothetical protein
MWVYDGQDCLGALKEKSDGAIVAYNLKGKRVGSFATLQSASGSFKKLQPAP